MSQSVSHFSARLYQCKLAILCDWSAILVHVLQIAISFLFLVVCMSYLSLQLKMAGQLLINKSFMFLGSFE